MCIGFICFMLFFESGALLMPNIMIKYVHSYNEKVSEIGENVIKLI